MGEWRDMLVAPTEDLSAVQMVLATGEETICEYFRFETGAVWRDAVSRTVVFPVKWRPLRSESESS